MEHYIEQNRVAYDQLAHEYEERLEYRIPFSDNYFLTFYKYLDTFKKNNIKVLDIGCGVGYHLKLLADKGYETAGVDLSSEMINIAKKVSPGSTFIHNNFLDTILPEEYYEAIISIASIHNYNKKDAIRALHKIYGHMKHGGYVLLTTNRGESSQEGFFSKKDYINKTLRFRKFRTTEELEKEIIDAGFTIKETFYVREDKFNKDHINIIAHKI